MTVVASREDKAYGALMGWQAAIKGTNTAVSGTPVVGDVSMPLAKTPLAAAVLAASSTYYYFIPTAGCSAVDVTLRASASTGTGLSAAATVYKVLNDRITEKMNSAGATAAVTFATFVVGTQQTVSIANLRGEAGVVLKIVVPGASTLTFDQAEFSAL